MKKLTIKDMQITAESRGGKCLDFEYKGNNTKLQWECAEGHRWHNTPSHIRNRGQWCPECAGLKKLTIEEMHEIAKSKGGKCLSKKYINVNTKLLWECEKGHRWKAAPESIKRLNTWCPECSKTKKRTLDQMRKIAKSKGGKCLSKKYINDRVKLLWECDKGHKWESTPGSVVNQDTWCPECAGHVRKELNDLHKLAKSRGGKCLSNKYVNVDTKYEWQCSLGHKFYNTFSHIKNRGQWCPTCSKSGISEEVCRTTFEQIFDEDFIKVRPKWLKNDRGNQMEIDGYSKKLKIGFEYHGHQHFETNTLYMNSEEKLKTRIQDDKVKEKLCKDNDVLLFVITHKTDYKNFSKEIKKQAILFGIDINKYQFDKEIDLSKAYIRDDRINELKGILDKKNIDLLSTKFLGVKERYKVKCRIDNHEWSVVGSEIISGAGCKKCSMRKLRENHVGDLSVVVDYADKHNGKVLSNKYIGANGKYKFKCEKGHVFCAKLSNLKHRKQWCPVCENRPITSKNLGCYGL